MMTQSMNTMGLTVMVLNHYIFFSFLTSEVWSWCYPLCVQRPSVQFSVATATPSHSRPPCLGSGAVHSLLRCLSQSELHADHSLHSPQPPSTAGANTKIEPLNVNTCTCYCIKKCNETQQELKNACYSYSRFKCIFLIALWNFTAKHFQGNSCATKNNVPLKVSKTCTKLVFLIWSIKRLHQFAFPPPYGLKDPLFLLIWKQRHPVYAQTQMQRKNPSEGDIWQRGDNVWRSALYSTDNFFLNLNLMSVFLYTPLWLKS